MVWNKGISKYGIIDLKVLNFSCCSMSIIICWFAWRLPQFVVNHVFWPVACMSVCFRPDLWLATLEECLLRMWKTQFVYSKLLKTRAVVSVKVFSCLETSSHSHVSNFHAYYCILQYVIFQLAHWYLAFNYTKFLTGNSRFKKNWLKMNIYV